MNSRLLSVQQAKRQVLAITFWLPVFFFSSLLIVNTIPYFNFSREFAFIQERAVLFLKPAYAACFYIHIFAGMVCTGAALLQFSGYILRKRRQWHIWSGRIYVAVVLVLGAPTGLYMSFFAKGSWAERGLFLFMALAWFFFTRKGFTSILKGKAVAHKAWMIRSYAMSLTAVTFRIYYLILYTWDVPLTLNYELFLWISVIGNLAIAEVLIYRQCRAYLSSFT